jgi:hypothetical protein
MLQSAADEISSSFIAPHSSLFFGSFRAVFRAAFFAVVDAGGVERAAYNGVTHTGEVFHTTAAHEHDRVLLQVVTFAGDVADHLDAVDKTHFSHFAKRRIRLLRGGGIDAGAHAALLRAGAQRAAFALVFDFLAALAHQLINGRHTLIC